MVIGLKMEDFNYLKKIIGIIGVGHIEKELISLLKPFNCKLIVNDIIDQTDYYNQHDLTHSSKDTIYRDADIISIHTPLTKKTNNMIGEKELGLMKPSTFLINTARGGIINEQALENALRDNVIAGAALDVYKTEPPQKQSLLNSPNLFCTPHIGGNAQEAVLAMGRSALSHLKGYLNRND